MYENILFEKKDGVAYLTLNRPDRLNALNSAVLKELDDALAAIDGDAEIRVLVVRGAGEKALAAGADGVLDTLDQLPQWLENGQV